MKEATKALVIGYGSIGRRHARILGELGCSVAVLSRRPVDFAPRFADLETALGEWRPDYVVVANRTHEHHATLQRLVDLGFRGRLLVEKPLFERAVPPPAGSFAVAAVAYNLRCHPLLMRLKKFLARAGGLVAAEIHAGQYLPQWRPETDYRESYSARREQGGGVLRDLSHELDYASWLFGPWRSLAALGGHLSPLEIDSDDTYSLLLETERCPVVSIHLNYLDRVPRREVQVNTREHTVRVDLIRGLYELDGSAETSATERDATYRAEHQAMLGGDVAQLCSLSEAMETLNTIAAAEEAAARRAWIRR